MTSSVHYNLTTEDVVAMSDFAASIDGEFGVDAEGCLVIGNVDAAHLEATQPFPLFYLRPVDEDTVRFEF